MKIIGAKELLIANRIKMKRREVGLSLHALYKATGIDPARVADIDHQNSLPTDEELEKLAAALGVSVQWLRTGRD